MRGKRLAARRLMRRRLAVWLAVCALGLAGYRVIADNALEPAQASEPIVAEAVSWRPVNNDCSGGTVTFTFDDGPRKNTEKVLSRLEALNIKAVFFWNGQKIQGRQQLARKALKQGHLLANHSWNHVDLVTGETPRGGVVKPWGSEQIRADLERTNDALEAIGAPKPSIYRPPYGSVNHTVDDVAKELGMRLVMPWESYQGDNILDSRDNEGAQTAEIVATITKGLKADSVITMHDGQGRATLASIEALQPIVDAMNEKRLCASTAIRAETTGRVLETDSR